MAATPSTDEALFERLRTLGAQVMDFGPEAFPQPHRFSQYRKLKAAGNVQACRQWIASRDAQRRAALLADFCSAFLEFGFSTPGEILERRRQDFTYPHGSDLAMRAFVIAAGGDAEKLKALLLEPAFRSGIFNISAREAAEILLEEARALGPKSRVSRRVHGMITRHRPRIYSIGRSDPIRVTGREDAVLGAFVRKTPLDYKSLCRESGYEDCHKVLKGLTTKYNGVFQAAIRLPGRKGQGGYHVSIRGIIS